MVCPVMHEVIGPDVAHIFCPEASRCYLINANFTLHLLRQIAGPTPCGATETMLAISLFPFPLSLDVDKSATIEIEIIF
jgi:hypothetical protein